MREILSQAEYLSRRDDFFRKQGKRPTSGWASMLGWGNRLLNQFHTELFEQNLGYETDVNDDYIALRDTSVLKAFFALKPADITSSEREALFATAFSEAFKDIDYLKSVHVNAPKAFRERCRVAFDRILSDRGF